MTIAEIRLPDHSYMRLTELANQHNVTVNELVEQWSNSVLTEFDAEMRFRAMSMRGSRELGLSLLDKLDTLSLPQAR